MIIDTDGYIELVHYLSENLELFTHTDPQAQKSEQTVGELFETELADNIMRACQQHSMSQDDRINIVREADAIFHDLEEVLASVLARRPDARQHAFIKEYAGLVKNLIDSELSKLVY
ncbi:DUF3802 family protein [Aliidiomarina celeris]|uniref:DUF3802 family protein n=1 Tax=Aliidiomarina celeris TaxID=2249428 RepID=UPI000DEA8C45|nr:DUF3802 family protein [Aliidiomarina celeris]